MRKLRQGSSDTPGAAADNGEAGSPGGQREERRSRCFSTVSSPEHKDAFVCLSFSPRYPEGERQKPGIFKHFLSQMRWERRRKDFPHPGRLK